MHWQTFISTLLGGLITYSAILLTNALDLRKRKRTHESLIHALLQGLRDEVTGLLEMAETSPVRPIEAIPEGKPYEGLFTASQDYFIVYHANAELCYANRRSRLAPKHHADLHARQSSAGHREHESPLS